MARPEKHDDEKRSETLRLRVTMAEHQHVREQAEAAGVTVSEYLRRRACGYVVPSTPHHRTGRSDPALLSELNKLGLEIKAVGNNANQLAMSTHTKRRTRIAWEGVVEQINDGLGKLERVMAGVALGVADEADDAKDTGEGGS